MEKLIVRNFLSLRNVELELGKINIVIGKQAEGKSILAKLVFFFKDFFCDYRQSPLRPNQHKKVDFDKNIVNKFRYIFPAYSWSSQDFEIEYHNQDIEIKLKNEKLSNDRRKIKLDYSASISQTRRNLINFCKKQYEYESDLSALPTRNFDRKQVAEFYQKIDNYLVERHIFNGGIEQAVFIPAGRSFFANLEKNIFSFLSSNISIDYLLREFGSIYEFIKNIYGFQENFNPENSQKINDYIAQIIAGNYSRDEDENWIVSRQNKRKIKVAHASSGQQEALPMLIILAVLPFINMSGIDKKIFLIEEPEAHLFPQSQKNIIDLISLVFNITDKKHSFFMTTHSPYILSAFNNLIQAGNTFKAIKQRAEQTEKSDSQYQRLFKVVAKEQMLDINDFSVYSLENGELKNIINLDNQLIDTNIIDEVSNKFSEIFDKLIDLEFEE
jgi:predicted ATP-dependent endonuclease of OLD family